MEKYILAHDDENQKIMNEYLELRAMTDEAEDALLESATYQEMKDWFLDKFPAIAEFHQKREELLAKAQEKKETKRQSEAREKLLARRAALLDKGIGYLLGLAGSLLSHVPDSALSLGTALISAFLIS